ncbi:hypothetical protein FUAX_47040 (plasmid) [Fulvitalea axinellae]|uniref:Uncharacterized protein n=1 Tax=Fulvitalea axinellae TaxID=1182444 RepID=A0AAU9CZ91_9BACT|nr:hypothetical protein FUAX_47040 [Fulvitalea axinellae]
MDLIKSIQYFLESYPLYIIVVLFLACLFLIAQIKSLKTKHSHDLKKGTQTVKDQLSGEHKALKDNVDNRVSEANSRWQKKLNKSKEEVTSLKKLLDAKQKQLAKTEKALAHTQKLLEQAKQA